MESVYDRETCDFVYGLYGVVVHFLQGKFQSERQGLMTLAYEYYRCRGKVENPRSLEDLRPVLEAHFFAFELERYDQAYSLLKYQLDDYLSRWGYWGVLRELYGAILPYVDESERAYCLMSIGVICRDVGDWEQAEQYFKNALSISQEQDNQSRIATLLGMLGIIESKRGRWEQAEELYRQCLAVRTELGDRRGMAETWGLLGDIERNRGRWERAEKLYQQSFAVRTELGDREGIAVSTGCLGENELSRGNLNQAEALLKKALEMMEEIGMSWHIAETNFDLALLWQKRQDIPQAQHHYQIAHTLFTQLGAVKDIERIEQEWIIDN